MSAEMLKTLLGKNRKAARHEDSIRDALEALKALRSAGVSGSSKSTTRAPASRKIVGKPHPSPYKEKLRTAFKMSFNA